MKVTNQIRQRGNYTEAVFNLGKVDYNGTGRRINTVYLEVDLYKDPDNGKCRFSASGGFKNMPSTDSIHCGQCLDTMAEFPAIRNHPIFKRVYPLWKEQHLKYVEGDILAEVRDIMSMAEADKPRNAA